jgi:hypothetical protein
MGVTSTQGFKFKLVANGETLDIFKDEDITLSDNVTGLFDLGVLPADFTRQISLPGTKKNNAFFEHVYDISIQSPDIFATNIKVPAYLDFDGIYLAQGYLQLNRVNVIANKFIDSYEVSIYGALSSFAKTINNTFLTGLTNLSVYNHTSSYDNIVDSWNGGLFDGDIVYPMIEYGQKMQYTAGDDFFGIDDAEGGLSVQDFKPAITVKALWDKIFEFSGYTYTSSFVNDGGFDGMYLVCNKGLKYPAYTGVDLENFGVVTISPLEGPNQTDLNLPQTTNVVLPWYNIQSDPSNVMGPNGTYYLPISSALRGVISLNLKVSGSLGGPQINFRLIDANTGALASDTTLVTFNQFFTNNTFERFAQGDTGQNQIYELSTTFNTSKVPSGFYYFALYWDDMFLAPYNNFTLTLDPNQKPKSKLEIQKVQQAADGRVIDIASNMPFGTNGIKLIDFIRGVQKKFNLIIYPNKIKPNEFIVETFNNWYRRGEVKDFNRYINLNEKLEVIPANNLAVNELNFGDTLDSDYVSQQFSKQSNREYGKQYYVDTQNFFSEGKFEVKTTLASSPLLYLPGTGLSGSVGGISPIQNLLLAGQYGMSIGDSPLGLCQGNFDTTNVYTENGFVNIGSTLYADQAGTLPFTGYRAVFDIGSCNWYSIDANNGQVTSFVGSCNNFDYPCP